MSRFTNSDGTAEFTRPGRTPRWFTTRYKSALSAIEGPDADLGTATDRGYDPAIASFPVAVTGSVCEVPTGKAFSSGAQAMFFRTEIEGNTAANLSVVMSFYEATYGDSAQVEVWTRIRTGVTMNDGDVVRIPTAGGRVLAHVDSISNPDNDASLFVQCRNASAAGVWEGAAGSGGGGEGVSEDELAVMGNYVWDAANDVWVRMVGSASGATTVVQPTAALLNCTEASAAAILADTTALLVESLAQGVTLDAIDADTSELELAVDNHDTPPGDANGFKVLIQAQDDPTSVAVADGDMTRIRGSVNGGVMVTGYNAVTTQTVDIPVEIFGQDVSNNSIPVSGRASDIVQLAVAEADCVAAWNTLNGARVMGGYDAANNLSRNLPVENTNDAAAGTGIPVGGVVDTTIPAAAADGDFMPLWMGPQGTVGIHGFDVTNNVPRALPVESNSAVASGVGVPILVRADTSTPTAVSDADIVYPWANEYGALAVFQTQGSDYTTSSVTTRETPASGGVPGTTAISNAASTPLSAGTSAPCKRVTVCNNGTGWMRVGVGVQTATTGIVLQPGDTRTMDVDDIAKVQAWAQNNNDACGWDYETV